MACTGRHGCRQALIILDIPAETDTTNPQRMRTCRVVQAVLPGGGHAVEESVAVVKPPALQPPVEAGEGLQADEVEKYLQYQV